MIPVPRLRIIVAVELKRMNGEELDQKFICCGECASTGLHGANRLPVIHFWKQWYLLIVVLWMLQLTDRRYFHLNRISLTGMPRAQLNRRK